MKKILKRFIKNSHAWRAFEFYLDRRIIKVQAENLDLHGKVTKVMEDRGMEMLEDNVAIIETAARGQLWRFAKEQGLSKLIVRLIGGMRLYCYLDSKLSELIYVNGFEESELEFTRQFLEEGDVFVDIGSNIGLFAITAAPIVGKSGTVLAFEPVSKTYERLRENVELNQLENVDAFKLGFSSSCGMRGMAVSNDGFDAWNSFCGVDEGESKAEEEVSTTTLDKFAESNADILRSALIKIDVEGWESEVLKGGIELFSRDDAPTLLVEFTDEHALRAGTCSRELYRMLEELGYKMYRYVADRRELVPDPLRDVYPYINLVATKNPDLIKSRLNSA